jgi:aerobic-type carbon monoxide dehydrogenase small subunit (CoxS/CutS family)
MPQVTLTVNGRAWSGDVPAGASLLDLLRERVGLTGAKQGCGEGQCGSCTVLVDGRAVPACMTPAMSAATKAVVTVEGLASDGRLHPVQQAFIDAQAFQCGFCTPGMIMAAKVLLDENPRPTQEEIIHHMDGNICRCTGYVSIIKAIQRASNEMAKEKRS